MGTLQADIDSAQVRVVLVDSREERRKLMNDVVEGDGDRAVVVAEADSAVAALLAVVEQSADAVVLDLRMPTAEGLEAVGDLRRMFPRLAIVVCSFDLAPATVRQALAAGADACLSKPASPHELVVALGVACQRSARTEDDPVRDVAPAVTRAAA